MLVEHFISQMFIFPHIRGSTVHVPLYMLLYNHICFYFNTIPADRSYTHPRNTYFHDQSQHALANGTAHSS